jgi:death-on-curing protein
VSLPKTEVFLIAWQRTIGELALADAKEIAYVSLEAEVRDLGLLDSALARPVHAAAYGGADLAEQAATLIRGIAENQALLDGNKRLALVVTLTFLEVNGFRLEMSDDEKFQLMIDMSEGMTATQVAELFRQRLRPHA